MSEQKTTEKSANKTDGIADKDLEKASGGGLRDKVRDFVKKASGAKR